IAARKFTLPTEYFTHWAHSVPHSYQLRDSSIIALFNIYLHSVVILVCSSAFFSEIFPSTLLKRSGFVTLISVVPAVAAVVTLLSPLLDLTSVWEWLLA
ncbi:hypothetical protein AHF37_03706, partial [Paragonimus kellicotti]